MAGRGGLGNSGNGAAGTATLGPVWGRSTAGGSVFASGRVSGGFFGVPSDVILIDAVDGATTGTLTLEQSAETGAGRGESVLQKSASAQSLAVNTNAYGDTAVATSAATNDAGDALASAIARTGFSAPVQANANARSAASLAGSSSSASAEATGDPFTNNASDAVATATHASDGLTTSTALAYGDAASARALASNHGASAVSADARVVSLLGVGAVALADASGAGDVSATSGATSRVGAAALAQSHAVGANASALAAAGSTSQVFGAYVPNPPYLVFYASPSFALSANAVGSLDATAEAIVTDGLPGAQTTSAWAIGDWAPTAADVAPWLSNNAAAGAAFATVDQIVAAISTGAAHDQTSSSAVLRSTRIDLTPSYLPSALGGQDFMAVVGLTSGVVSGTDFGSLRVRIENFGALMFDQTFLELSDFVAFLSNGVIELQPTTTSQSGSTSLSLLSILFDYELDAPGQAIELALVVGTRPVPEPVAAMLMLIGALACAFVRWRLRMQAS